jgi:tetratricopeptide (TPR) repeat protein
MLAALVIAHAGVAAAQTGAPPATARAAEPFHDGAHSWSGVEAETAELVGLKMKAGELEEAAALCRGLLAEKPGDRIAVRQTLAAILLRMGDANGAYREAITVLDVLPAHTPAHALAAEAALRAGLPSLAVRHARSAAAGPGASAADTAPLKLLAQAYLADGATTNALPLLEDLVQRQPDDADALVWLGSLLAARERYAEAEPLFDRAQRAAPQSAQPFVARGQMETARGRTNEAAAAYRAALEKDPRQVAALNNLALLLADDPARGDEALAMAGMAWQFAPDNPLVADTLGWLVLRVRKEPQRAAALLGYAVRKLPRSPDTRYHLAAALHAMGQLPQAEKQLQAALAAVNPFPAAAAARALLESIRAGESASPEPDSK